MNRRLVGTAMLVLALIGCSDKSTPIGPRRRRRGKVLQPRNGSRSPITGISLVRISLGGRSARSGPSARTSATATGATKERHPAVWSIDNMDVATIDESGEGRGVGSGEATVTAQAEGLTGTVKVRVVPSYEGTWEGDYVVRTCRGSGTFDAGSWCGDGALQRWSRVADPRGSENVP